MKMYIAGGMEKVPNHEEKFEEAEKRLVKNGHIIINPVKLGKALMLISSTPSKLKYSNFLLYDIIQLQKCKAIYMLKGWENSPGATAEYYFAKAIKLEIYFEGDL